MAWTPAEEQREARTHLADSLREQMMERVRGQHQIVVVAAAIAGAAFTVGDGAFITRTSELVALLCLLYVGLALGVLRHDQEITIIASHLLDDAALGAHAEVQASWEAHKLRSTQGSGAVAFVTSSAETMGIYGLPVLGVATAAWVTLESEKNVQTWIILGASGAFFAVFAVGAADVYFRYRRLGERG